MRTRRPTDVCRAVFTEPRVSARRFHSFPLVVMALLLVLTMLGASQSVIASQVGAQSNPTAITGWVYQDFNSNGVMNTTSALGQAVDVGVAGIEVRAFDSTGAQVGHTTTGGDGTYTLSVTSGATNDLRVEFSIPSGVPALEGFQSSFATSTGAAGSTAGSAVQFATLGDSSVNYAINRPSEYCQNNPNLVVSRQCLNSVTAPSLWVTRYDGGPYISNSYSNVYNDWTKTTAGSAGTTGSIHGLAWEQRSGRILSAAYVRSFVPLYESPVGTPRPAAIFSTTPAGSTAAEGTGGTTAFLVDLETLLPGDQFSNTTAPPAGVANAGFTGYIPSNAARNFPIGPDADINASYDGVYEEVGKAGIGDIDTDGQGNLYVVSLYTRELYRVTIPSNGSAPTSMSSVGSIAQNVSCNRGEPRPFGVTYWRDNLYMGVVCDGSQDFNIAFPNSDSDERNMTYSIVKYSPSSQSWSSFLGPFPLYAQTIGGNFKGSPIMTFADHSGGINHNSWRWNPWTDQFTTSWSSGWAPVYPTPMPSDLQFDRDGSVIVSMRDRTGDRMTQMGVLGQNSGVLYPDGTLFDFKGGISGGDMYRICRIGGGYDVADYVWEGNTGCQQSFNNFGFNNNGIAYEYYRDDYGKSDVYHGDQSAGMLEYVAGFGETINTAMDPHLGWMGSAWDLTGNTFSSGGLSYYLNSTGDRQTNVNTGGGVIFNGEGLGSLSISDGTFGKVVGMGDVEALCDMAPVQIGDRLWIDTDGDGIQDPDEDPIAGVTVRLYDEDGVLVSTAVTNAKGEYTFVSTVSEAADGGTTPDSVGGNLHTGAAYTIRFDNPDDYVTTGPLVGYGITAADETTTISSDLENGIDSDAVVIAGFPRLAVPPLSPGENNHSFDAGFVPLVGVGDLVWIDSDGDGIQDVGELPLAGVAVELFDSNGDPARDAVGNLVPPQITGSDGTYFFDGLFSGEYQVKFTAPTGYVLTATTSGNSANDSNPDQVSGMTPVFSVGVVVGGDTVSDSDAATVARFVNPTIDAGFVPFVSVGDFVWSDTDRDGVQDSGEPPLSGVVVTLTNADGSAVVDVLDNPVTTTVTDVNGNYSFDLLPLGQYVVTVADPEGYVPTVAGVGSSGSDSSTGSATSVVLSVGGQRDATLDFGFVVPPPIVPPGGASSGVESSDVGPSDPAVKAVSQMNVTTPGREVWLNPESSSRLPAGARWVESRTKLWDSSQRVWSDSVTTPQGVWTVIRGTVRFVPNSGFVGHVSIPFRLEDNSGRRARAQLFVSVVDQLPATGSQGSQVMVWWSVLLMMAGYALQRISGSRHRLRARIAHYDQSVKQ